jgi:hypothetical protein
MNDGANDTAVDLFALLAEVTAPDFFEKNPEIAASIAADNAKRAARDARDRARVETPCGRCRGTGSIPEFRHIANGDCFACDATGIAGFAALP